MTFRRAVAALEELVAKIDSGEPEPMFATDTGGDRFEFGPGKITVIGAPPGTGKTALANQLAFEALDRHWPIQLAIANAEMSIEQILRREIARRARVSIKRLRNGAIDQDDGQRIVDCLGGEDGLRRRIQLVRYMEPPFTLEDLGELTLHEPGMLVLDYLQKFAPPGDALQGVNEVMTTLRLLAHSGWAVLAMSATTRISGKDGNGHDHSKLSMSSFKGSGEIEFNADAGYVLRDLTEIEDAAVRDIDLDCVKNRGGARHRIELRFCGDFMRFEARGPAPCEDFTEYSGEFTA